MVTESRLQAARARLRRVRAALMEPAAATDREGRPFKPEGDHRVFDQMRGFQGYGADPSFGQPRL